jgi:Na+-driven multidrug efflux pump
VLAIEASNTRNISHCLTLLPFCCAAALGHHLQHPQQTKLSALLFAAAAAAAAYPSGLDWWTFEVIVMLSGLLPNPEQTMSMMGITFNIHALCFFAAHGLSGAASTRVGNDLGAGRPHMAWLTVQVCAHDSVQYV